MANIFNVFSDITESKKNSANTAKALVRSKSSIANVRTKVNTLSKPKGLSVRSYSELNIPASSQTPNVKRTSSYGDTLKPTQLNNDDQLLSPRNKELKKKETIESKKIKDVSPKTISPGIKEFNTQKSSPNLIFKKPFTPKKFTRIQPVPEPESLAPYCDPETEFDNMYNMSLSDEMKTFLMELERNSNLYEDEGFISEPEELLCLSVPKISLNFESDEQEYDALVISDLSEISDDDV